MLTRRVGKVEFLPSAHPPHKSERGMLPFSLRVEMLRAVLANFPHFFCNGTEGERTTPSYTYETLKGLGRPESLYFLLGSRDFSLLGEWWRGMELPQICNLVIVPREEYDPAALFAQARTFWPMLAEQSSPIEKCGCMANPGARLATPWHTEIYFLNIPHLDISASRIRALWLGGRNIDYLVPCEAMRILEREARAVTACWRENSDICSR